MIDDEILERELVARARSGLSPSSEDEARVKRAVLGRIALAPLAETDEATSAGLNGRGLVESAKPWLFRLGVAAVVAAGSGAGYYLGHRAGVDEGRASVASAPREGAEPVLLPSRAEPAAPAPVSASTAPPLERPLRAVAPIPSLAPAGATEPGLDEEVRLLRRVERALRDRNPRYAMALLGELDRTVPGGQLVEERQAARAMARCALEGGGDAVLKKFAEAHPGSAYFARVAETCQGVEQRISGEAETHPQSGERK